MHVCSDLRDAIGRWELVVEDVLVADTSAVCFDAILLPEHMHGVDQVSQYCNTTQKKPLHTLLYELQKKLLPKTKG